MAEIKWIKLSVNMFDDEKVKLIRTMPEGESIILIWVQLLCLAGKINDGGLVYMGQNLAYSDEMLATILGHPLNIMRAALNTLVQFEMIEVNDEGFIDIVNWEKHQSTDKMAAIKESNRERQQKYYYRNKLRELGYKNSEMPDDLEELKELSEKPNVRSDVSLTLPNGTEVRSKKLEVRSKKLEVRSKKLDIDNNHYDDVQSVIKFYESNFGMINTYVLEELKQWTDSVGHELVIEAMKRSLAQNVTNYNYVNGILKNFAKKGITTLEQAQAEQVQFENQKQSRSYNKPIYQEDTPDWAKEGYQEEPQSEMTHEELADNERKLREKLNNLFTNNEKDE